MKKELENFLKLENEAKEGDEEKNYKNCIRTRGLKTTEGYIEELKVPRARKGFYPHILEKHKRGEDIFNDLIRSLYSCNASTRDIKKVLANFREEIFLDLKKSGLESI